MNENTVLNNIKIEVIFLPSSFRGIYIINRCMYLEDKTIYIIMLQEKTDYGHSLKKKKKKNADNINPFKCARGYIF